MKKSAEVLQHHFDLERLREPVKDQNRMDNARVNLGIVLANQKIESYKHMVLNNLQGLVDWKVKRDPKHFQWDVLFVIDVTLYSLTFLFIICNNDKGLIEF